MYYTTTEQARARRLVGEAVRRGELVRQPCECGATKTVAHHDDYARPLDIRWMCHGCHRSWHWRNGPGANSGRAASVAHKRLRAIGLDALRRALGEHWAPTVIGVVRGNRPTSLLAHRLSHLFGIERSAWKEAA